MAHRPVRRTALHSGATIVRTGLLPLDNAPRDRTPARWRNSLRGGSAYSQALRTRRALLRFGHGRSRGTSPTWGSRFPNRGHSVPARCRLKYMKAPLRLAPGSRQSRIPADQVGHQGLTASPENRAYCHDARVAKATFGTPDVPKVAFATRHVRPAMPGPDAKTTPASSSATLPGPWRLAQGRGPSCTWGPDPAANTLGPDPDRHSRPPGQQSVRVPNASLETLSVSNEALGTSRHPDSREGGLHGQNVRDARERAWAKATRNSPPPPAPAHPLRSAPGTTAPRKNPSSTAPHHRARRAVRHRRDRPAR